MNNFEDDLELQMCGGCGRRFERRAALNSHSQICQKRIAVQNNIKARRPSPPTSATASSRITTKILPSSTEQQPQLRTETTKNDVTCVESNTSRLMPLSVLSESMQSTASGIKSVVTTSPSPVSLDISNPLLATAPSASYHRTRHCSGTRSDTVKKDIPEKRIEIQIRRDYCKTGIGAGTMSSILGEGGPSSRQQDCNSETNENQLSCDDTGEGNNHDEVSNSFTEDCEGHSGLYQSTESDTCFSEKGLHLFCGKLDGSVGINACSFTQIIEKETIQREEESTDASHICLVPAVRNINDDGSSVQSVQDACLDRNGNQSQESSNVTKIKDTDTVMRFIEKQDIGMDKASDERIRWNSPSSAALSEDGAVQGEMKYLMNEQKNVLVPAANTKKEEQFSPVMENRMRSIINIRRLQCLPCQKKFNKLTNLRRHVAVHIGWNRYRCTECAFKCFSKYDCVAHVIKIHLEKGEHDKAQSMVEYIETEISDIENDVSNCEPTEETSRSHSEENGQNMLCDINLSNKCTAVPEDIEITVNDTTCNKISNWSLQECDEGKTITSTSDYDISIEAVPNDIQNLVIKLKDAEDNDLYACDMEGERADDAVVDMHIKRGPLITTGATANSAETSKMKSDNVDETLVKDTAIILQAEEASKHTTSTSPVTPRLKRCCPSTEGLEHEEPEALPSKKLLTTTEYQQSTRNVAVLGKRQ